MSTPASNGAEDFLRRVFPGEDPTPDPATPADAAHGDVDGAPAPLRGVDERTQRLLEPIGDPDRESW